MSMPHTRNSKRRASCLSDPQPTSPGGYARRTLPIPKATSGRSTNPLKRSQRGKRSPSVARFGHHSAVSSSPRKETMTKREQKLLRVGAAAHEVGLHPITVRRWIQAGRIQAVSIGREVRVPRAEIERLVGKLAERLLVLYGRVSGHGQKVDLDIQLERLQAWAKTERKGV